MSQRNVEKVIGRLVTDEAFRRWFLKDPRAALVSLAESGVDLNPCELRALAAIDSHVLAQFADAIDPCIQKSDLHGGTS